MGELDRLQSRGLFENLEIHTPPKNHKIKYHPPKVGKAGLKTIMVITRDGQLIRACGACGEIHSGGDCASDI